MKYKSLFAIIILVAAAVFAAGLSACGDSGVAGGETAGPDPNNPAPPLLPPVEPCPPEGCGPPPPPLPPPPSPPKALSFETESNLGEISLDQTEVLKKIKAKGGSKSFEWTADGLDDCDAGLKLERHERNKHWAYLKGKATTIGKCDNIKITITDEADKSQTAERVFSLTKKDKIALTVNNFVSNPDGQSGTWHVPSEQNNIVMEPWSPLRIDASGHDTSPEKYTWTLNGNELKNCNPINSASATLQEAVNKAQEAVDTAKNNQCSLEDTSPDCEQKRSNLKKAQDELYAAKIALRTANGGAQVICSISGEEDVVLFKTNEVLPAGVAARVYLRSNHSPIGKKINRTYAISVKDSVGSTESRDFIAQSLTFKQDPCEVAIKVEPITLTVDKGGSSKTGKITAAGGSGQYKYEFNSACPLVISSDGAFEFSSPLASEVTLEEAAKNSPVPCTVTVKDKVCSNLSAQEELNLVANGVSPKYKLEDIDYNFWLAANDTDDGSKVTVSVKDKLIEKFSFKEIGLNQFGDAKDCDGNHYGADDEDCDWNATASLTLVLTPPLTGESEISIAELSSVNFLISDEGAGGYVDICFNKFSMTVGDWNGAVAVKGQRNGHEYIECKWNISNGENISLPIIWKHK